METLKTVLKPDLRGDYRPYIGYRTDGKQHRFNLGSDLTTAIQRRDRTSRPALAHGKPFKDDLLTSYSNVPFPRLFEVQKRYRQFLMPVFQAESDI